MKKSHVLHQVEVTFWTTCIRLLSESPTAQIIVWKTADLFSLLRINFRAGLLILLSFFGLTAGFLLGVLSTILIG